MSLRKSSFLLPRFLQTDRLDALAKTFGDLAQSAPRRVQAQHLRQQRQKRRPYVWHVVAKMLHRLADFGDFVALVQPARWRHSGPTDAIPPAWRLSSARSTIFAGNGDLCKTANADHR